MSEVDQLAEIGQMLRVDSVRVAAEAGSGHPTSSMSAADLMAVLVSKHLRYDFAHPERPDNDHLIFSKGHASPLLYSIYRAVGAINEDEFLTYRKFGSRLEGHPTPVLPWVDVATGSLGQGLGNAVGVALAGKHLDRLPYRVWCLCGDSEMAEGSMWEAFEHAGYWKLDNLTAIIDVNRLGQRGPTMYEWDLDAFASHARSFGWHAIEIDGHDIEAIDRAYAQAASATDGPTVIVARTVKGKGVAEVENKNGFHGRPLPDPERAIEELGGRREIHVDVQVPTDGARPHVFAVDGGTPPTYDVGASIATRKAYGEALAALGSSRGDVVALDGEVSNSTHAEDFKVAHPDRFFEQYISEQQMIAAAVGMQVRGWKPYASTFASFLSRAYDFIRMAAVSRASVRLVGSHAGVSIGEDGPSQMALEDLAMMRAVHGSTVLYPCDGNQTVKLVDAMADLDGIVYLRTSRPGMRVIYDADATFPVGGSRVVRSSAADEVTLVGAGITLHEALAAAERLAGEGITARVIDAYSVKPIDQATLVEAARQTGRILVAEDHWPEGGLGDAVLEALADAGVSAQVRKLAVRAMPGSGTPAELLSAAGIDAAHIASAASEMVKVPAKV